MYADFLTDRCDIYHLTDEESDPQYGLRTRKRKIYRDTPDLTDVPCHFGRRDVLDGLTESYPRLIFTGSSKLQLPLGTDIRTGDRIVDKESGCSFTAGVPRVVGRNHHIAVHVNRLADQEAL